MRGDAEDLKTSVVTGPRSPATASIRPSTRPPLGYALRVARVPSTESFLSVAGAGLGHGDASMSGRLAARLDGRCRRAVSDILSLGNGSRRAVGLVGSVSATVSTAF
jgi:hypothetical protein